MTRIRPMRAAEAARIKRSHIFAKPLV